MSQVILNWELFEERIDSVERYCSSCGRKVIFYDSMVRRHNANGKKIFKYAIYKCEKGHTWNKMLDKYFSNKANILSNPNSLENNPYRRDNNYKREDNQEQHIQKISLLEYSKENINKIDIFIRNTNCKIRLDKLLTDNLIDISRTQIQKKIKTVEILVNDKKTKCKYNLKDGDKITIYV